MAKRLLICCLLLVGSSSFLSRLGKAQNGISVLYSFPPHELSLHEPVVLTFTVKNESASSIQLDLGQDRKGEFLLTVKEANGKRVTLPRYGHEGISIPGILTVDAGKQFSQELIINEWYAFKTPGKYELEIQFSKPIVMKDTSSQITARGSHGEITIGPRNVPRLQSLCDHLSKQIESADSYERASNAALELSYVTDPVAVPYLERVLISGKMVEKAVVEGLERIADESAIRILIATFQGGPNESSLLARAALQHIQTQNVDPRVKMEIEHALHSPVLPKS